MAPAAVVLSSAWVSAVVAWGWRHRPPPVRMATFIAEARGPRPGVDLLGVLGRSIRRVLGRPPDNRADRRMGWAVVMAAPLLALSPVLAFAVATAPPLYARFAERRQRRRSAEEVLASVPDTIDLFVLAAGSGRPVPAAVAAVATRATGPVGEQLRRAARRIELGERAAEALHGVSATLGDPVGPLITALVASDLEGTPLVPALERLAAEARLDRRRRAEEAARKVPVKLLFPLVCCTLPAFALLTVVPLLVGVLGSLRL